MKVSCWNYCLKSTIFVDFGTGHAVQSCGWKRNLLPIPAGLPQSTFRQQRVGEAEMIGKAIAFAAPMHTCQHAQ